MDEVSIDTSELCEDKMLGIRKAVACASAAVVAAGTGMLSPAPALADGALYTDWTWQRNDANAAGARIRYVDYFRVNNSGGLGVGLLPDNVDVYGGACITVPANVNRVEVVESFRTPTVGLGGISASSGGSFGASVAVGGDTTNVTWAVNKSGYDHETNTWSTCSDYGKSVPMGRTPGDWGNAGRIHITTTNNAKIYQVQHRVTLRYYDQYGPHDFSANGNNWESTYSFGPH